MRNPLSNPTSPHPTTDQYKTMSETSEVQKPPINPVKTSVENDSASTPLKAIRKKCLDCCCNDRKEVKLCPCLDCPLWNFRTGHYPKKKEQK